MLLSIVLPTYNEKENVKPLIKRLLSSFSKSNFHDFEIVFVDDSTDETPKIISKLAKKYHNIRLIHRSKKYRTGLATAFITGYDEAKGDYILCMDTDLQHPPEIAPKLLQKAIDDQADVVVGSRYIKGGSAIGLGSLKTFYGIYRRAISIGLKYFIQILFIPIRKTSDPGSGLFLFRKNLLDNVKLKQFERINTINGWM